MQGCRLSTWVTQHTQSPHGAFVLGGGGGGQLETENIINKPVTSV